MQQGNVDDYHSSESLSQDDVSRHSSIQGPYREGMADTSFPTYCTVESAFAGSRLYSRSLLPVGNGMPIYNPEGNQARSEEHLKQGALLGDVGHMHSSGSFEFCFNIFHSANHPMQQNALPRYFAPLTPPLSEEESVSTPHYFPAGTVLTSEGIKVTEKSSSPLEVEFDTSMREGAVLVLPTGASREELVDPSRIYPYVNANAVSWYQFLNGDSEDDTDSPIPNGTIYVVIGVDRADSWATATFPQENGYGAKKKKQLNFKYVENTTRPPWNKDSSYDIKYTVKKLANGRAGVVFLRLMAVALSPLNWSENVAYVEPEGVPQYLAPSPLKLDLHGRIQMVLSRIREITGYQKPQRQECFFHPSLPLLHSMLLTSPSAKVGIVTDSMWSSQMSKRSLTHLEVVRLIHDVLTNFDVVNTDGILTLVRKRSDENQEVEHSQLARHAAWTRFLNRIAPWILKPPKEAPIPLIIQNMNKVLDPNLS